MNNMNISSVKPATNAESHDSTVIPKITLPSNSLSQTTHNSLPRPPVVTAANEIPLQVSDKPLNLYVTPVHKNATNTVPVMETSNLETLKPLPMSNSLPPLIGVTNTVTKEEKESNKSEVSSSNSLPKSEPTEQNALSPVVNQNSLVPELPKVSENENVRKLVEPELVSADNTDDPKVKETTLNEPAPSVSNSVRQDNLNDTPQPIAESKIESPPLRKRKRDPIANSLEKIAENGDAKPKRMRLPTQVYQCPIPEMQLIAKLDTQPKPSKPADEKLITFYKNEFLAVRNPEGSFYICQTFQNIHRRSTKIKIRWFNDLPNDVYKPDFVDETQFDCILTNVKLIRLEKDKWKLPQNERTRIVNILKRALDVEKGVAKPSVTEEHPDGLDLSLYTDEAQLSRRKHTTVTTTPKRSKKIGRSKLRNKQRRQQRNEAVSVAMQATSKAAGTAAANKKSPQTSYLSRAIKIPPASAKSEISTTVAATSSSSSRRAVMMHKPADKKSTLKNDNSSRSKRSVATDRGSSSESKTVSPPTKCVTSPAAVAVSAAAEDNKAVARDKKTVAPKKLDVANVNDKTTAITSNNCPSTAANASTSNTTTTTITTDIHKVNNKRKSPMVPLDKPTKIRNAGSAVAAKISSAATQLGKSSRDRKTSVAATVTPSTTNKKKK